MAKDFVSSLGDGELNALMSMQVKRLDDATKKLVKLFADYDFSDFSHAYQSGKGSPEFIKMRDDCISDIRNTIETMDKIRIAQSSAK